MDIPTGDLLNLTGRTIVSVSNRESLYGDVVLHFDDGTTIFVQKMHIWDNEGEIIFQSACGVSAGE